MDCQARGRKVRIIHHRETLYLSFLFAGLNPDASRLYPYIGESTPSVSPFSLAVSFSRTLQTRSGALSLCRLLWLSVLKQSSKQNNALHRLGLSSLTVSFF
jgi:hypothetical protein